MFYNYMTMIITSTQAWHVYSFVRNARLPQDLMNYAVSSRTEGCSGPYKWKQISCAVKVTNSRKYPCKWIRRKLIGFKHWQWKFCDDMCWNICQIMRERTSPHSIWMWCSKGHNSSQDQPLSRTIHNISGLSSKQDHQCRLRKHWQWMNDLC